MNIVIIGAGDIGLHLATLFSQLDYGIVLVDVDRFKLEKATRDLDVATKLGDATDWELLEELLEFTPDLIVALTEDDETNLVVCSIAKNLGYPQTIARVRSNKYFKQTRLNFERLFSVDHFIGPEKLTADAIANMILIPESIASETFAHGSIHLRTIKIPQTWKKGSIPLKNRPKLELPNDLMIGLIRRLTVREGGSSQEKIIFPHGEDVLLPSDEVTFIGESEAIQELPKFFGLPGKLPKSVMIVGGSLTGINLAQILQENQIQVRIIEKDLANCTHLAEKLPYCTVVHRDGTDYKFLQSEKIEDVDVFVACTQSDEVNFLAASIAKNLGAKKVIISIADINYLPMLSRLGITQAASPRLHAANRILSIAREKTISSMVSYYNNQADIMEVKVSPDSKIAGIPIRLLGPVFPQDFLILAIQSRGRIYMADGSRVLSPSDTAIIISSPKHINEIKKIF